MINRAKASFDYSKNEIYLLNKNQYYNNMKKTLVLGLLLTAFIFTSNAQAFDDGTNLFSIGFGIPPAQRIIRDYKNSSNTNFNNEKINNYGTFIGKFEHGLHKYFGLGLNVEYSAANRSFGFTNKPDYIQQERTALLAAFFRFNGHIPVSDKFDIYGGLGLGYERTVLKSKEVNSLGETVKDQKFTGNEFGYQLTIGARYMIKESIGLFAEFGRASSIAQVGCAFKF